MPSELYKNLGKNNNVPVNPREQALNLMRQQGIDIPKGKENDPNFLINHVMQSGKVPTNRLGMAQQFLMRRFGRG